MKPPLSDVLVIDLSRVLAGPYCTMMLGDLGAKIIKIEAPVIGDGSRLWGPPWAGGESAYYLCVNRNKKSITLNLKSEKGREIVRELVRKGDILVENFRVGTMERWGLDYESLRKIKPGLIYCSITGYGQYGPYKDRPGYDFIIQAQGGIMSITGPVEGPPMKVAVAIVDVTAGLYAAVAILAALHEREHSGEGQHIDIALLDSQVAWLINVGSNYLVSGEVPKRYGNAHPNIVPYEPFETRDGWIALGVGTDHQWRRFCKLAGCEELGNDPRFVTNPKRVENREALIPLLQRVFKKKNAQEWLKLLLEAGIPCAPINNVKEVFEDSQVRARDMVVELPHPTAGTVRLAGSPLKLSRTPARMEQPPPLLGQHTEEVLSKYLGYTPADLARLQDEGVI